MKFFGYGEQDFIPCEMCGSRAVDIHHIEKRNKTKNDYIENLIALCRDCHINAESDTSFNSYCRIEHLELVCRYIYALIDLNKKLNENRKQIN
tara:strand:+ start:84 stop:362 length:279 start_codon:yes stop_codon:yes gene_type:complete